MHAPFSSIRTDTRATQGIAIGALTVARFEGSIVTRYYRATANDAIQVGVKLQRWQVANPKTLCCDV